MTSFAISPVIEAMVTAIQNHADELTALDQAIGDGDHGINMKRGFTAIAAIKPELEGLSASAALQKIGMTLVMKVGGASGPLYGSFFMAMGKALPEQATLASVAAAFAEGVEAVKKRGKSEIGEKTMLDVLVPVSKILQTEVAKGSSRAELVAVVQASAETGLQATKPMQATKGRASFLGERSIGHLDPGARSSCLLIKTVCIYCEDLV